MASVPAPLTAATLLAALAGAAPAAVGAASDPPPRSPMLQIQQRVVVRVQRADPPRPTAWKERKGPKCVPVDELAGAVIADNDAVDLVMAGGERIRARLHRNCPTLNFYSGFYLKPARDGQVCARRDPVRSRAGGTCEIDEFRRLVAKR